MRDIIVTLIVFGSIPLIFARPYIGILMWAWIAYLVPHKLTWGFAFDFPFAMVVGLVTILSWLISKEPKVPPVNAITVLLFLFALWVSATTIFAVVPDEAVPKWNRMIKILFMTFVTILLIQARERVLALVWVIVGCIAFYGVKGGIFTLRGGAGLVWGPPGGFFEGNNELALTLIMAVPLMRFLQLQSNRRIIKYGMALAMLLSGAAVVGTYSRGALLAGVAMAGVLVWHSRRRYLLGAGMVVVLLAALPFLPAEWIERMESIRNYQEDGSAVGRLDAWTFGWRYALDHPIFGGGFNIQYAHDLFMSYVPSAGVARAFHSVYFEVLGEHGFVGLAIFLALGIAAYRCGGQVKRLTRGQSELSWAFDLASMIQVCLVGYAVGGTFLSLASYDLYYNLIAIVLVTKILVIRQLAQAPQDAVAHPQPTEGSLPARLSPYPR